ncbi:MAG: hypothetical protein HY543_04430 [Deltaproteobacteria bacterium]|nr:hypothetical protein [Deltaproteobacteria bacterium]
MRERPIVRLLYRIAGICIALTCWTPSAAAGDLLHFDRGAKKGPRQFQSVETCVETPCVITQHGAWRFAPETVGRYRITMAYVHEGGQRPIELFQQSTSLEQKLGERILNRYPNRKVVNLMQMVEAGKVPIVYMYGILLQHDVDEGDLIAVRLTNSSKGIDAREFYFRYHKTGPIPDIDIAFLYPINFFNPNPGDIIQGAMGGVAFSFSVGTNMDPERRYSFLRKLVRAVRLNAFTGFLTRKELRTIGGDLIVSDAFDGFGGFGFTLFDFLNVGYGINLVRAPHATFPFVGLEVRHVFEFLRSLKRDTHTRWEKYLRHEAAAAQANPP